MIEIILVDDDLYICKMIGELMRNTSNVKYSFYTTPEQFLSKYERTERKAYLFSDYNLGSSLNGLDVLTKAKEKFTSLFLTSSDNMVLNKSTKLECGFVIKENLYPFIEGFIWGLEGEKC